jgi:hypothetical protein
MEHKKDEYETLMGKLKMVKRSFEEMMKKAEESELSLKEIISEL